jgi:hypothetical protein
VAAVLSSFWDSSDTSVTTLSTELVAAAASCVSVFAVDAVPEHPANRSAEAVMIAMIEATLFIISSPFHEKYFVHLFPYSVFYSEF